MSPGFFAELADLQFLHLRAHLEEVNSRILEVEGEGTGVDNGFEQQVTLHIKNGNWGPDGGVFQ